MAAIFALVFCVGATAALARVGGGESYSSGSSSSSFSSSGDDAGSFLFDIIVWLLFNQPIIGIPLVLLIIGLYIHIQSTAGDKSTRNAFARADAEANPRITAAHADAWVRALKAKDPGFELLPFLDRVQKLWLEVQEAWFLRDLRPVRRYLSDATYLRLTTQLDLLRLDGVRDAIADMEPIDLSIVGLSQSRSFDTVDVRIRARGRDSEVPANEPDAAARQAAKAASLENFAEVWSFVRRPETKTVANPSACPNCGALWEGGAANTCAHCMAVVNSGVYDWTLAEITQDVEHMPRSASVTGEDALIAADPAFNREGLEDRASLCFWKWIQAQVLAQPRALARVATPALVDEVSSTVSALSARGERRAAKDCAVGGVTLASVERDGALFRAHVEVRFSARWAVVGSGEPSPEIARAPMRWMFSLERHAAVQTDAKRGMSSACCPNCGAPTGESTAPTCEYCSTPLGTSEREWVLARAVPWERFLAASAPVAKSLRAVPPDRRERQRLLYAMAQLAQLDGAVSDAERNRLHEAAARWGLEPKDVTVALSPSRRAAGPAEPIEKGSPEARAFLQELVALARVDGRVDGNEKKMLGLVAGHLGLQLGEFLRR